MRKLLSIFAALTSFCLTLSAGTFLQAEPSPDLSGTWSGKISINRINLTIVFNIGKTSGGDLVCTMESPDQGEGKIPASIEMTGRDSIRISIQSIGAVYTGRCVNAADGTRPHSIEGMFTQRGAAFPLELSFGRPIILRPQTPMEPYPYKTEEVTFSSSEATLSGTLTYPSGYENMTPAKVPVVLMVTGSGQQNRDEEIFNHRPFKVIADYLARNGIASLRYDDRGTGRSSGDPLSVTMQSNLEDALAGMEYLDSLGKFGPAGMLGHSEGGCLALMAGAEGKTDFIISLAGGAVSGKEILVEQNRIALRDAGMPEEITGGYCRLLDSMLSYKIAFNRKDSGKGMTQNRAQYIVDSLAKCSGIALPEALTGNITSILAQDSPWIDSFLEYEPEKFLGLVSCPVLALNGSLDTQVIASQNLEAFRAGLPENPYTGIKEYPGLNHLFQHCRTGSASEYGEIIETISKEVLKDIAGWISGLDLQ